MISGETTRFVMGGDRKMEARQLMAEVMGALEEKGYNPINQLVGYFVSGDPTYITNFRGARATIRRMERDELLEVILSDFINSLKREGRY